MNGDFYLLCEGFHDRDFLSGWFESVAGWEDVSRGGKSPVRLFASEGTPSGGHVFAAGNTRVCLWPMAGREKVRKQLRASLEELTQLGTLRYAGMLVVADPDQPCSSPNDAVADLVRTELTLQKSAANGPGPWQHRGITIDYVSMRGGEAPDVEGLPPLESLERILLIAFARAFPARYQAILAWLRSRPDPHDEAPGKSMSWSAMAGWFAEKGCTDFLRRAIWQQERLRQELERGLVPSRLATVVNRLRT